MARPLTNALQNFLMSKQAREQSVAQQQQQQRAQQTREGLGQMIMGGDPGNLAQVNPEAFIMGQQHLQQQAAQEAQAKQQGLVQQLRQEYAQTQDPEVLRQLAAVDPQTSGKIQEQMGIANEAERVEAINQASALAQVVQNKPDEAMDYYRENLEGNPAFEGIADELEAGDYESVLQGIGVGITALGGQQAYDKFSGVDAGATDPSAVREYQFYQNLTPEQRRQYLTVKRASQTFREGDVTMAQDPTEPTRAQPIVEPGAEPTTQPERQEVLSGQAAEKAAGTKAATQAIETSQEAFKQLEPIRKSIANTEEAIELIDEGAKTGPIMAKLPSIREASIKLDNLQGRLGLDVIGTTTFGALSEAELKFALDTALPKKLEGEALKEWLKEKKKSQEKLASYLEDAAVFLGKPGNTIADFIEKKRQEEGRAMGSEEADAFIQGIIGEQP